MELVNPLDSIANYRLIKWTLLKIRQALVLWGLAKESICFWDKKFQYKVYAIVLEWFSWGRNS